MPLARDRHPDDEQLARFADALGGAEEDELLEHVLECERCRTIVDEARRGLARLALNADVPPELEAHARARRWAMAREPDDAGEAGSMEDIAEVAGRDLDPTTETDSPPGAPSGEPGRDE